MEQGVIPKFDLIHHLKKTKKEEGRRRTNHGKENGAEETHVAEAGLRYR
jgi:hypothetical protein